MRVVSESRPIGNLLWTFTFLLLTVSGVTAAPDKPRDAAAVAPRNSGFLPRTFAGWEQSTMQRSTDPALADAAHAPILKEYGFTDLEAATYLRPEGREMTLRAVRFGDASGAFGAFSFYKTTEMLPEQFGDQGASFNERALFYRGNVLVEAKLDRVTAMSAAELRELSNALPLPQGPARNLPSLPSYMPRQAFVENSAKYLEGPLGLQAVGSPIPAQLVDFARGAEVVEGKYSTSAGTATLMLVGYPTPQIAGERLHSFNALDSNSQLAADQTLAPPLTIKRSGPIVAIVAGQISAGEARSLLASVHYDADVTWNENTHFERKNNVANLLVNIVFLIGIILGFCLVAGIAFGGVRILVKRFFPGRVFDRPEDVELIQLGLGLRQKGS